VLRWNDPSTKGTIPILALYAGGVNIINLYIPFRSAARKDNERFKRKLGSEITICGKLIMKRKSW
jgi:hypothetical protein